MPKYMMLINPFRGHINPTLPIVRELAGRGNPVHYYSMEKNRELIENHGAIFHGLDTFEAMFQWGIEKRGETLKANLEDIFLYYLSKTRFEQAFIDFLDTEIGRCQPDFILYDYFDCYWGKMAAIRNCVPCISISPGFVLNKRLYDEFPYDFCKYILRLPAGNEMFTWSEKRIHKTLDFISNQIRLQTGDPQFHIADFGNSELLNIAAVSDFLQPHKEVFDDSYLFIGYSFEEKMTTGNSFMQAEHNPRIYISLGTTNVNENVDFYRYCISELSDSTWEVVISVGETLSMDRFGRLPANIHIQRYADQKEILSHADLFVTHGGINSITESLFFGVPMICIPVQGDQYINSSRVEELGAGIVLEGKLQKDTLCHAIEDVLKHGIYYKKCRDIQSILRNSGGYRLAVDRLVHLNLYR